MWLKAIRACGRGFPGTLLENSGERRQVYVRYVAEEACLQRPDVPLRTAEETNHWGREVRLTLISLLNIGAANGGWGTRGNAPTSPGGRWHPPPPPKYSLDVLKHWSIESTAFAACNCPIFRSSTAETSQFHRTSSPPRPLPPHYGSVPERCWGPKHLLCHILDFYPSARHWHGSVGLGPYLLLAPLCQLSERCKGRNPLGELVGNPGWQLVSN